MSLGIFSFITLTKIITGIKNAVGRIVLICFHYNMDDATMTYMVRGRVKYDKPKQEFDQMYKTRILEMTQQLMDNQWSGAVRDAFEVYVSECISHFKRQEFVPVEVPILECDKTLYPKKLKLVKQKNIQQMYERTHS
jgi:hypothetical protein